MTTNAWCVSLLLLAGVALFPCATAADSGATDEAISATSVATEPTIEALLAMEKRAHQAYFEGNSDFFSHFFSDKLVVQKAGARLDKAAVITMISGVKCEVEKAAALSAPELLKIDSSAYVLTYVSTMQGRCSVLGAVEEIPSPVRAATVWVREGTRWQAAFRGAIPIFDFAAPPAAAVPNDGSHAATTTHAAEVPALLATQSDPITNALMAVEEAIWRAWKTHDAELIAELTSDNIAFVNLFGTFFADKAATTKDWTSTACDVTNVTLTNGTGTAISPTVGVLTVIGVVEGTCGEQDIGGQKIYASTVYVKSGDTWKWAFGFNSPT